MPVASFLARYGPWALVAGASEGSGAEFSRQLAARGLNVVLVSEPASPPDAVAREIRERHGVRTRCVTVDLATAEGLDGVEEVVAEVDVGLFVYNAAFAVVRAFAEVTESELGRMMDVNVRAPLLLTRRLVPRLAEKQRGGIVLMSSIAGSHGAPYVATYAATKAFNLVLGESLWYELGPLGIDVLAWCPGATDTPGYVQSGARRPRFFEPPVMSPRRVVAEALERLGTGPSGIAGLGNRLATAVTMRLLPRRIAVAVMGRAMTRRYGKGRSSHRRTGLGG